MPENNVLATITPEAAELVKRQVSGSFKMVRGQLDRNPIKRELFMDVDTFQEAVKLLMGADFDSMNQAVAKVTLLRIAHVPELRTMIEAGQVLYLHLGADKRFSVYCRPKSVASVAGKCVAQLRWRNGSSEVTPR